jgi:cytochrome P450
MNCLTTTPMGFKRSWVQVAYIKVHVSFLFAKFVTNQNHTFSVYTQQSGADSGLISLKNPIEHGQRRQIWNKAFSSTSLKSFETVLIRRTNELIEALTGLKSDTVDIVQWMEFFT